MVSSQKPTCSSTECKYVCLCLLVGGVIDDTVACAWTYRCLISLTVCYQHIHQTNVSFVCNADDGKHQMLWQYEVLDCPVQTDGHDCGIWAIWFSEKWLQFMTANVGEFTFDEWILPHAQNAPTGAQLRLHYHTLMSDAASQVWSPPVKLGLGGMEEGECTQDTARYTCQYPFAGFSHTVRHFQLTVGESSIKSHSSLKLMC